MIKINRGFSLQPLLFATALPLGFLAAGLAPVNAAVVSVTGANGRPVLNGGSAGGSATATTTKHRHGDRRQWWLVLHW